MNGLRFAFVGVVVALLGFASLAAYAEAPAGHEPKSDPTPSDKSILAEEAAQAKADGTPVELCECVRSGDLVATKKIEWVLTGPLHSAGLDFTEQPLQDVATALQDEYNIPIQLNKVALEEAGLATDTQITVSLRNISLRSALRLMLKQFDLRYVIHDEVLVITTKEDAEKHLVTCVYNVQGLVDTADKLSMDSLINAIQACVATDTWSDNGGGQADIRHLPPGLLVVSQTAPIHEEVAGLLTRIRKMREQVPAGKMKPRSVEPARVVPPPAPAPSEPPKKTAKQATPDPGPAADDPFGF